MSYRECRAIGKIGISKVGTRDKRNESFAPLSPLFCHKKSGTLIRSVFWIVTFIFLSNLIMPTSKHRHLVLLVSVAITCLLAGAGSIGYYVSLYYKTKLDDPKFLQTQLTSVTNGKEEKPTLRPPTLVRVETAKKSMIHSVRPFYGRLVEVQRARISTEVAGLIVELPIEVGMKVIGGQTLIAQIDKTWIDLIVKQTEAEVKILKTQYEFQQSESERIESLAISRAITESELSSQRALLEQYRQNLEKAIIANREAQEKLKRTTIIAPFDGYVVHRATGLGELLSTGTPIAEIVSLGHIDAIVNIGEKLIDRIKIGDEMPIIIDPLGVKVIGKVHSIVPYGPTGARYFPVVVRLDDHNGQLKVGMSATALVSTTDPHEEIVLPKDAVLMKPDGSTVWVVVENETENGETPMIAKPVAVTLTDDDITEYGVKPETEEGKQFLVAGAKAVIEGADRLIPNQRVRITEIEQKLFEDLPSASGHKIIEPKERVGK
jgi:RND family efflux transporter MFP subunit